MRSTIAVLALVLSCVTPSLAGAEMARVTALPAANVFSLWADGDTILAGVDTCVFVSTDAGASWHASARVAATTPFVVAVHRVGGRIYAGTASQGVFVSNDLGATWSVFNQGLVGGLFDSQLHIAAFASRGDSLYVATLGAGVYVRPLIAGGTWHHFGDIFAPEQAENVWGIALGGTRLLSGAGGNGVVFRRDPADGEWSESFLDNAGLSPGVQAQTLVWNGRSWIVGTTFGVYHSTAGQEPWIRATPDFGATRNIALATRGSEVFAAFDLTNDVLIATSHDDGATWNVFDDVPFRFVFALAVSRDAVFAARNDGLFRFAAVSGVGDVAASDPGFRLVGAQPAHDLVRFRIELPHAGDTSIEVFDVTGRRVADPMRQYEPAGSHEVAWDARSLAPGVYLARLTAEGHHQDLRVVHVR